jgi:VIT1/CCC1 family predicted Fe2+/Mn2+ transporter
MPTRDQLLQFARHYVRDMVYAANDGLVTTLAVVAGAQGARLNAMVVLALGFANLAADGLSMGLGNYLGIKSERAAEQGESFDERVETVHALRHGAVTWLAFVAAGLVPLLPFLLSLPPAVAFPASIACTAVVLFAVGAARTGLSAVVWWRGGLEMLIVGALAGGAAFAAGWGVQRVL